MTKTTLSRRLTADLAALKQEFTAYSEAFTLLTVRRAHFAPVFMRTFTRYQQETDRSFVAFVRELDPSMPVLKAEYPNHRSYQAALYLRRIAEAPSTVAGQKERPGLTPLLLLAALMRSLLVRVHPREDEAWAALIQASGWRDREINRLRELVEDSHYFVLPDAPRLVHASERRHEAIAS